mmetsp:Transcript_2105/g.7014  ORF Transcript_2105/g.7014 Transcript_2105/m.7014 type:complete len:280 (+) Transcript_2105:549-1388(+)
MLLHTRAGGRVELSHNNDIIRSGLEGWHEDLVVERVVRHGTQELAVSNWERVGFLHGLLFHVHANHDKFRLERLRTISGNSLPEDALVVHNCKLRAEDLHVAKLEEALWNDGLKSEVKGLLPVLRVDLVESVSDLRVVGVERQKAGDNGTLPGRIEAHLDADADEEEADDRQLNGGGNQIGAEDVNWIDRSGARIFDGCKSAHHFVFLVVHAQGVELNHIRVVRAEGLEASGLLKAWQESHADAKVIVSRGVHAFVVRANQLVVVVAEARAGQGLRELG